jgi:hypothetical protein
MTGMTFAVLQLGLGYADISGRLCFFFEVIHCICSQISIVYNLFLAQHDTLFPPSSPQKHRLAPLSHCIIPI